MVYGVDIKLLKWIFFFWFFLWFLLKHNRFRRFFFLFLEHELAEFREMSYDLPLSINPDGKKLWWLGQYSNVFFRNNNINFFFFVIFDYCLKNDHDSVCWCVFFIVIFMFEKGIYLIIFSIFSRDLYSICITLFLEFLYKYVCLYEINSKHFIWQNNRFLLGWIGFYDPFRKIDISD